MTRQAGAMAGTEGEERILSVGDSVLYEGALWQITALLPFRVFGWTALTLWHIDRGDRHIRDIDLDKVAP